MRNLIYQSDLTSEQKTLHPLPTSLLDFIDSMSIVDEYILLQDIVAFLPQHTHDMLLDIRDYIRTKKSSELLSATNEYQLSKLFTTHIPDIMWRHIQVDNDRDLVRLEIRYFEWFVFSQLCSRNNCTMSIFGHDTVCTSDFNDFILYTRDNMPYDFYEFKDKIIYSSIVDWITSYSNISIETASKELSSFIENPTNKNNPVGNVLKSRFPSVFASYQSNYNTWLSNYAKNKDENFVFPNFLLWSKEMLFREICIHSNSQPGGCPFAITENGFIVQRKNCNKLSEAVYQACNTLFGNAPLVAINEILENTALFEKPYNVS